MSKQKIKVFQLIFQACSDCCKLFEARCSFSLRLVSPAETNGRLKLLPFEGLFFVFFFTILVLVPPYSLEILLPVCQPCCCGLHYFFLSSACVMVWCAALMWMQRASVSALLPVIFPFSNPDAGAMIEDMKTSLLGRIHDASPRACFTKGLCGFCGR